jgi:hypothetical protein
MLRLIFINCFYARDTFEIQDSAEHRVIPGIIFVAEVKNSADLEGQFSREKHTEVLWIDPASFYSSGEQCVPNFSRTLEKAAMAWRQNRK